MAPRLAQETWYDEERSPPRGPKVQNMAPHACHAAPQVLRGWWGHSMENGMWLLASFQTQPSPGSCPEPWVQAHGSQITSAGSWQARPLTFSCSQKGIHHRSPWGPSDERLREKVRNAFLTSAGEGKNRRFEEEIHKKQNDAMKPFESKTNQLPLCSTNLSNLRTQSPCRCWVNTDGWQSTAKTFKSEKTNRRGKVFFFPLLTVPTVSRRQKAC